MTTTTGTVTTSTVTLNLSKAAVHESPELTAEIDALRPEMPDATVEQILSRIIRKRLWDHFSALATKPA